MDYRAAYWLFQWLEKMLMNAIIWCIVLKEMNNATVNDIIRECANSKEVRMSFMAYAVSVLQSGTHGMYSILRHTNRHIYIDRRWLVYGSSLRGTVTALIVRLMSTAQRAS